MVAGVGARAPSKRWRSSPPPPKDTELPRRYLGVQDATNSDKTHWLRLRRGDAGQIYADWVRYSGKSHVKMAVMAVRANLVN